MNSKIELVKIIDNLTQVSQVFVETAQIPQESVLDDKITKLEVAINTAHLLVNCLNDIFGQGLEPDINIKIEPIGENAEAWPINAVEINNKSKTLEEEIDGRSNNPLNINLKNEPLDDKIDICPSNVVEANIDSEQTEDEEDCCQYDIAEVNIKSEALDEETEESQQTNLKKELIIKKYKCEKHPKCKFKARDNYGLRTHQRIKHQEKLVTCSKPWCQAVLGTLFEKELHIKTCLIICSLCGKSIYRGDHWRRHQRSHEEKTGICEGCGITFSDLNKHKTHCKGENGVE